MARTPKERLVGQPPLFTTFKPAGIMGQKLEQVQLELDEYEAIRLADFEGLEHEEAAEAMGISRSTFTRLIAKARRQVAIMLVDGAKLSIGGGNIRFREKFYRCLSCQHIFKNDELDEKVVCPKCKHEDIESLSHKGGRNNSCHKDLVAQ